MPSIIRLWHRLRRLARRDAVERALDAEMQHHLECEIGERIRSGMTPDDARREAFLAFGGVDRFKEEVRDALGTRVVEDLWRDAAYAARVLQRNPAFTAAACLTFALALGVSTAIFSVVYGVLLRPLPYAAPERLVAVWERDEPHGRDRNVVSLATFLAWRERSPVFEGMAALVPRYGTVRGRDVPERIAGAEVTPGYFGQLGVAPELGRDLKHGDANAVVVSQRFWRERLGSDPFAVGRAVSIDGAPYTVVGVMPERFSPPEFGWLGEQELWYPFVPGEQARSWGRFLLVVGRLKPGVTVTSAESQLVGLSRQLAREHPENEGWSASVVGLREQIVGDARPQLVAALTAGALLLVLAVGNVATLTLSTTRRRGHELAIRRAIGATDRRLFRQLFVQSAMLGLLGSVVGIATAFPALRVLLLVLPPDVPRASSVTLDGPVFLASTAVAVSATVMFGVVSGRRGRPDDDARRLQASSRITGHAGGGLLVASEVALALALGVLAILTTRSFSALRGVDVGFDPGGVVAARVALPGRYDTPARQRAFFGELLERMRTVPGVTSAGIVNARPFTGLGPATTVYDPSEPPRTTRDALVADARYADDGFFSSLRIPFVAGTRCLDVDADAQPLRVIVNQSLARAVWPGRAAVARRLRFELFGGQVAEVCGVVRDVHLIDSRTAPRPTFYLPFRRFPSTDGDVLVRAGVEPGAVVSSLRAVVASIDRSLPLYRVDTLSRTVDTTLASDRFAAFLLGTFAIVAVALSAVGIFGLFAGEVAARRREIGIRVALGSGLASILALFLRRALLQAVVGLAAGSVAAWLLARLFASLLFGVTPADPVTYGTAASVVLVVTVTATALPAWLAMRRSPLAVLRET